MGEKEKQQLMMLGGLILVLVIAVTWSVGTSRKKINQKRQASTTQKVATMPAAPPLIGFPPSVASTSSPQESVDAQPRLEPEFGTDPFFPDYSLESEQTEVEASVPRLNGISWDAAKPVAVIDETIVEIGDMVGEYMIIDIERNSVTISDGTEKIKLRL